MGNLFMISLLLISGGLFALLSVGFIDGIFESHTRLWEFSRKYYV